MIYYYAYMGLLILALALWAVIAVREDAPENGNDEEEPQPKG
jgi:hypothetical protein